MKRNAQSVIVQKVETPAAAGSIVLVQNPDGVIVGMNHCCPCGCGRWGWIAFKEYGFEHHWERTGDDWERLTLTPSIGFLKQQDGNYHWHGYLRNGVFEEC